ncbi:MAG TPA: TonB-dependent receptor, partial [Sphingomonas sanguinis]|nr:TonB-dependent receptor [Sphingomonas sanguinis]
MFKPVLLSGLSATALASLLAAPATAQTNGPSANRGREIVVTAPVRQSETDVLAGTSIVTGDELERSIRPTIGET